VAYIYRIVHIESGTTYVGQTTRSIEVRWKEHVKCATKRRNDSYLYRAMRLYGIDAMRIETLEECSVEALDEREKYWVEQLGCLAPAGYNMSSGGSQPKQTEELKQRQRERAQDPEWKRKVSEGTKKGWHAMTEEKKQGIAQKVSEKLKGRSNWWCIGRKPGAMSEEAKKRMIESKRGKTPNWTDEGRQRIIESHTGFNSHRVVLTPESVEELLSLYDPGATPKMQHYNDLAARFGISEVTVRRLVKGYHWAAKQSSSSIEQQYPEGQVETP
jgi:group I intron endonuclease